ncbi:hypothetical protein [Nocardia iowensis]|uniref:Uncharacterized protein n=1 Tax=Nocardia iowensis TaxID=204891 RepID=A0ABX8RIF3_NOCIO|nr:hypothetical protein [Nocardia iowensis]QXN89394.1 hypothetical protein KV110_28255 [Nocardia iowensis]
MSASGTTTRKAPSNHRWPRTSNPHLIVSRDSVLNIAPVSDYHLIWNLGLLGIELEHIRSDRILREALSTNADPLHLALTFGLSAPTAVSYATLARTLTERPIETAANTPAPWD